MTFFFVILGRLSRVQTYQITYKTFRYAKEFSGSIKIIIVFFHNSLVRILHQTTLQKTKQNTRHCLLEVLKFINKLGSPFNRIFITPLRAL